MEQRSSSLLRVAAPLKSLVQRFTYLGLIFATFGLMLLGRLDAVLIDRVRIEVTDAVAPVLEALSRPVATVANGINNFKDLSAIRQDNQRLEQENSRLMQWQTVARKLQAENTILKTLVGVAQEEKAKYITARVIAASRNTFSHSIIANEGQNAGLRKGQAVISVNGLIGRVSEVSDNSARILLLTDIISRIPVIVESTRTRAILAGGNTGRPHLIHLPPDAKISPSERIVTSGHGGAFAPGIPIGVVASVREGGIEVQLFTDFDQLEYVRIADYGLDFFVDSSALNAPKNGKYRVGITGKK